MDATQEYLKKILEALEREAKIAVAKMTPEEKQKALVEIFKRPN